MSCCHGIAAFVHHAEEEIGEIDEIDDKILSASWVTSAGGRFTPTNRALKGNAN